MSIFLVFGLMFVFNALFAALVCIGLKRFANIETELYEVLTVLCNMDLTD